MNKSHISGLKSLIIVFFFLAFVGVANAQTGYKVGDIATDFKLKNVDGKMISMADYKDAKGFFVIFTCNHCPYAKAYESRIMDLDKQYASKGYPVMAISPNDPVAVPEDSFDNMRKLAEEKSYTFPYMLDDTQEITKAYGAKATPHVYLLKKTGKGLVVQYIGAIDNDTEGASTNKIKYAEDAVNALLVGKKPVVKETKAIGCSIKWKNAK